MNEQPIVMNQALKEELATRLLAMADDELILGHRDSQWCGHAPILEEDIAFANIALDEIGHAAIWYTLLADLSAEDRQAYPDRMIYRRTAAAFRNAQLAELPNGDWAFSILRQYLFDVYENVHLKALASSTFAPLAQAAAKIRPEEMYHLRHSGAWVRRLGQGTQESNRRLQAALGQLWPYSQQLFHWHGSPVAEKSETLPAGKRLYQAWLGQVIPLLGESDLDVSSLDELPASAEEISREAHTPHLKILVDDLQSIARLEPEATW